MEDKKDKIIQFKIKVCDTAYKRRVKQKSIKYYVQKTSRRTHT